METISNSKEVKANKEHRCNFCSQKIRVGEVYINSTHKNDGIIYDWKTHKHCSDIAMRLNMYEDCDEGVTQDDFFETINSEYFDIMLNKFTKEEINRLGDVIQEFRKVWFKDKLGYVIRHYAKIDKEKSNASIQI